MGMQRPEKYQTIYVNVKQDDMTEKTAGEVEGFGHGIVSVLKKIGGNIVTIFQHKIKMDFYNYKIMKNVHLLKY